MKRKFTTLRSQLLASDTQRGFTIIELLVAMALGVFLIGSMTVLFFTNKSIITTQNNVSKIQDDSQLAIATLENDISVAGFKGCAGGIINPSSGFLMTNTADSANYYNSNNYIQGSQGTGSAFSPALDTAVSTLSPAPSPKMDVLTVRASNSDPSVTTADMTAPTASISVSSNSNFFANNYAFIGSCFSANLFKIQSTSNIGTVVNPAEPISTLYPAGTYIFPYNTITYYVGVDNVLYKVVDKGTPVAIARNVEKFTVLYGVDTNGDGDVNKYVFAPSVSNFQNVLSVRIGLVIKSNDINTVGSNKTTYSYKFNGNTFTPGDGKVRKVYYTSVSLRNVML